jgi:hypothetical protein
MAPSHHYEEDFRIWGGLTSWELYRRSKLDAFITLGGSLVLIGAGNHLDLELYADTAGLVNTRPEYKFYGGGLQFRYYILPMDKEWLDPYVTAGYGVYHAEAEQNVKFGGTVVAPRFTLGVDLGKHFFLEGSYDAFGTHFERDYGRFGAEIGFRF